MSTELSPEDPVLDALADLIAVRTADTLTADQHNDALIEAYRRGQAHPLHAGWPIRVGGVYRRINTPSLRRRVTCIAGDDIHSVWDDSNNGDLQVCAKVFRKAYAPEDQSPLPAMRAILSKLHADERFTAFAGFDVAVEVAAILAEGKA